MIKTKYITTAQFIVSLLLLLSAFILPLIGCTPEKKETNGLIPVFVSIEPQRYFIERIGGEYISVDVMVKPGQSPATYGPTPGQITKLGKASVFFSIGVPFEHAFIDKIGNTIPELNIVDTTVGIVKRTITGHDHNEGKEEHSDEHTDEKMLDPHVWMSPILVKKQASVMLETLISLDAEQSDYFRTNYNQFIMDLDKVHSELKTDLAELKGSTMFVYHPSFGYFTDLYGLKQIAIETEGKEPGPKGLETIINEIISDDVKVIFVQPEFQSSSIAVITETTGASVMPVDPLSYDYLNNLRYIADALGGKKAEGY
ncbi:MAG: zinc ABC transporter substrate-binding protein [Spirochaetales bacterium]|nr:zinc ABC transporter substrate-binding protein [Spirochaetales bacterium]